MSTDNLDEVARTIAIGMVQQLIDHADPVWDYVTTEEHSKLLDPFFADPETYTEEEAERIEGAIKSHLDVMIQRYQDE